MYDQTKIVILTGSVKEFQWSNPHALLWLIKDATETRKGGDKVGGDASADLWSIELPTSPGVLRKLGWTKRSLVPGDRVAVEINPLRSGEHGGSFKKVTNLKTGEVLTAITSGPAGPTGAAAPGTPAPAPAPSPVPAKQP